MEVIPNRVVITMVRIKNSFSAPRLVWKISPPPPKRPDSPFSGAWSRTKTIKRIEKMI